MWLGLAAKSKRLLAGVGASAVVGIKAEEKSTSVEAIAVPTHLGRVAEYIIIPSAILLGIFGVLTAWQEHRPLTGGAGNWWLVVAYFALGAAVLIGLTVMLPHSAKAEKVAAEAAAKGQKTPELQKVLSSPVPKIAGNFLTLLIIFFLVLMVFKPF